MWPISENVSVDFVGEAVRFQSGEVTYAVSAGMIVAAILGLGVLWKTGRAVVRAARWSYSFCFPDPGGPDPAGGEVTAMGPPDEQPAEGVTFGDVGSAVYAAISCGEATWVSDCRELRCPGVVFTMRVTPDSKPGYEVVEILAKEYKDGLSVEIPTVLTPLLTAHEREILAGMAADLVQEIVDAGKRNTAISSAAKIRRATAQKQADRMRALLEKGEVPEHAPVNKPPAGGPLLRTNNCRPIFRLPAPEGEK